MVLPQSNELQSVLLWSLERCLLNPKFLLYIQLVVFQNGIYPCLIFRFPVWGFGKKQNKKSLLPPSYHKKIPRVESESNCFFLRQRRTCCVSTKYTCYGKSVCVKLDGFSVPMGVYWVEQFRSNKKVESEMVPLYEMAYLSKSLFSFHCCVILLLCS